MSEHSKTHAHRTTATKQPSSLKLKLKLILKLMLPIKFGFGYSRSRSSFLVVGYNFAWRLLKGVLVLVMINTEENHNDSLDRYKVCEWLTGQRWTDPK